jgi:membrane fusion protein, heavy metal efflux system
VQSSRDGYRSSNDMSTMKDDRNRTLAMATIGLIVGVGIGYGLAKFGSDGREEASSKAAAAPNATDTLSIPDDFLRTMNIVLETVEPGDLGAEVQAPGTVSAAPNGQALVTARAAGTVVRLEKKLGDEVKAGEVLAFVESREAAAMAAERTTAESKVELARSVVKREQTLFDQKVTPRQDLEAAQAELAAAEAEAVRARATAAAAGVTADGHALALASPIAGRITASKVQLGAYVEPDFELFRVSDPRFVLVEAAVRAADAKRVASGDAAKVITAAGAQLDAQVVSVTPTVDEQTRSATVTLSLAAGQSVPSPGEFVQTRISARGEGSAAFVVPDEAVQSIRGRDATFVRDGQQFRVTPVTVGARSGGRVAIVSGLRSGDVIATTNAFLLKAELGKGAEEED